MSSTLCGSTKVSNYNDAVIGLTKLCKLIESNIAQPAIDKEKASAMLATLGMLAYHIEEWFKKWHHQINKHIDKVNKQTMHSNLKDNSVNWLHFEEPDGYNVFKEGVKLITMKTYFYHKNAFLIVRIIILLIKLGKQFEKAQLQASPACPTTKSKAKSQLRSSCSLPESCLNLITFSKHICNFLSILGMYTFGTDKNLVQSSSFDKLFDSFGELMLKKLNRLPFRLLNTFLRGITVFSDDDLGNWHGYKEVVYKRLSSCGPDVRNSAEKHDRFAYRGSNNIETPSRLEKLRTCIKERLLSMYIHDLLRIKDKKNHISFLNELQVFYKQYFGMPIDNVSAIVLLNEKYEPYAVKVTYTSTPNTRDEIIYYKKPITISLGKKWMMSSGNSTVLAVNKKTTTSKDPSGNEIHKSVNYIFRFQSFDKHQSEWIPVPYSWKSVLQDLFGSKSFTPCDFCAADDFIYDFEPMPPS